MDNPNSLMNSQDLLEFFDLYATPLHFLILLFYIIFGFIAEPRPQLTGITLGAEPCWSALIFSIQYQSNVFLCARLGRGTT
jgi:hypothetical protein